MMVNNFLFYGPVGMVTAHVGQRIGPHYSLVLHDRNDS